MEKAGLKSAPCVNAFFESHNFPNQSLRFLIKICPLFVCNISSSPRPVKLRNRFVNRLYGSLKVITKIFYGCCSRTFCYIIRYRRSRSVKLPNQAELFVRRKTFDQFMDFIRILTRKFPNFQILKFKTLHLFTIYYSPFTTASAVSGTPAVPRLYHHAQARDQ